jgi:putative tryptophan/tyrosine transport system substrate-binding protein
MTTQARKDSRRHLRRWLLALSTFCCMAAIFTSCSREQNNKKKILLLKYAVHPALDELENSFLSNFSGTNNYTIIRVNANGNQASAKQLAETYAALDIELIVTLATPASQAVAKTGSKVPFVYAAVADPQGSGVQSARSTGIKNASKQLLADALDGLTALGIQYKIIGTIFNPTEQNSKYVQSLLVELCNERGIELKQRTASDASQLQVVAEQLAPVVDLIFCSNDNLVNNSAIVIGSACQAIKKPFVIGELNTVRKGACIGIGIDYAKMGKDLASLTMKALNSHQTGGKLPDPLQPPKAEIWINRRVFETVFGNLSFAQSNLAARVINE